MKRDLILSVDYRSDVRGLTQAPTAGTRRKNISHGATRRKFTEVCQFRRSRGQNNSSLGQGGLAWYARCISGSSGAWRGSERRARQARRLGRAEAHRSSPNPVLRGSKQLKVGSGRISETHSTTLGLQRGSAGLWAAVSMAAMVPRGGGMPAWRHSGT